MEAKVMQNFREPVVSSYQILDVNYGLYSAYLQYAMVRLNNFWLFPILTFGWGSSVYSVYFIMV